MNNYYDITEDDDVDLEPADKVTSRIMLGCLLALITFLCSGFALVFYSLFIA